MANVNYTYNVGVDGTTVFADIKNDGVLLGTKLYSIVSFPPDKVRIDIQKEGESFGFFFNGVFYPPQNNNISTPPVPNDIPDVVASSLQSIFKGKVVADDGTPLSGVNITIKSTPPPPPSETTATETTPAETTTPIDKSITTNEIGEWEFSCSTTDVNPENLTITFEKEDYDLSTVTNISQTSETILTLDIPLNEVIPTEKLSPATQEAFKKYNQDNTLILIRDGRIEAGHPLAKPGSGGRTLGAIYYKGKLVAYTVEDIVRFDKKVDKQTAIPAGDYYINLDATGNPNLVNNYVSLPGKGKYPANWPIGSTKKVFIRVGNDNPVAVNVVGGKITFSGSRIHAGSSENSSSGCIIVSYTRDNNGILTGKTLDKSFEMTKLVYDNNITRLIVINDFDKRTFKRQKK